MRCFIFSCALLAVVQNLVFAQWMVEWEQDTPLDSVCGGSGHPIADGTMIYIFHDEDSDGPDFSDPLLMVCDNPPNCPPGSANYNTFTVNGADPDIGMPGGFLSSWYLGYLTTYISNPCPNRIYLWICVGNGTHYVSPVYTPETGAPVTYYDPAVTCLPNTHCNDCWAPPYPTNFSASDSALCRIVVMNWNYPDSATIPGDPVDSVFVYRDGCRIGGVRSSVIFFTDTTISQTEPPLLPYHYYVKARRACRSGSFAYATSAVDYGSIYPLPRPVTNFSASDTNCHYVHLSWTMPETVNWDSLFIMRNGVRIGANDRFGNFFYHYTSDTTRAAYSAIGWSIYCSDYGFPSEVDSGQALACSPITEETTSLLPATYHLHANYPNPFNSSTQISFDLPRAATVSLAVFNIAGQRVATLMNGMTEAGNHTVRFDGSGFPSGVYFVRMEAGTWTATQKMLLLK
jgi:hypothetical protein